MVLRVLVVDDRPDLARAVARQLRSFADTVTAGSLATALDTLALQSFDAVLTDYEMPDGDGLCLLAAVRDRYPHIRRVLMSGHREVHARPLDDVVHATVEKPFTVDDIARALGATR